jgi:SAM-dependent methyltransferase
MGVGFGGSSVFNMASPSASAESVARILRDYVEPATGRPRRILDVGGTRSGFAGRASLPPDTQLVIANPEPGAGADVPYAEALPANDPGYDLVMLFGVMMYLPPEDLRGLLATLRDRLRGAGTLLIAEPDPEGVVGRVEIAAKSLYALVKSLRTPTRFHFHTRGQTEEMLRGLGFTSITPREDLRPRRPAPLPPPQPPYFILAAQR